MKDNNSKTNFLVYHFQTKIRKKLIWILILTQFNQKPIIETEKQVLRVTTNEAKDGDQEVTKGAEEIVREVEIGVKEEAGANQ